MGGERASSARKRLRGETCALCGYHIPDPPQRQGERICGRCEDAKPRRRVLMNYQFYRGVWNISFLEADCRTSLPRRLTFASAEKIEETARLGNAALTSDLIAAFRHGIEIGRGGVWLNLTNAQYRRLHRR